MSEVLKKELEKVKKQEKKFLEHNENKSDNILNKKLSELVPENLQGTLDSAFFKAFSLIYEKGKGIIEKTYNKDELKRDFEENIQSQNSKSIREISKKAKAAGNKNMLVSGAAGIGMGALGAGIPDIPVFTAMILKNVYEIALNYGFEYDSDMEKFFVLLVIEGAVSYGNRLKVINKMIDAFIEGRAVPGDYIRKGQMQKTANALSKELLYMKFIQGIPIVGLVGGVQDMACMRKITAYAEMKYRKRVLYKMQDWLN